MIWKIPASVMNQEPEPMRSVMMAAKSIASPVQVLVDVLVDLPRVDRVLAVVNDHRVCLLVVKEHDEACRASQAVRPPLTAPLRDTTRFWVLFPPRRIVLHARSLQTKLKGGGCLVLTMT